MDGNVSIEKGGAEGRAIPGPLAGSGVLVVEDDAGIAELIALYLGKEGAIVSLAATAEDALTTVAASAPSLVVLDLGLPGADGLSFLREFRKTSDAPVIVVSARESDEDKISALGLGADDFVQKPFSPRVLAARALAQARRAALPRKSEQAGRARGGERFGAYEIDADGKLLLRDGKAVKLSRKEFELLAFLASFPRKSFRTEELYHAVWGKEFGDMSTVAVHIQRLRRKIETDPSSPEWIRTVPGSGYRFMPEEER
jgi:DNA-binding response OmpR family regulator